MLIIKNAKVYSPEYLGVKDILTAGGKILAIEDQIDPIKGFEIFDASGKVTCPGFIDQHIHLIGAGGKDGFFSMTPDIKVTELVKTGSTTVVGLLGTDGATRNIKTLYAKVKALDSEGITAFMYSGYYGLDPVHIMDNIQEEMIFIDKVLGCKIAISDIRSSYPREIELLRILRNIRVGGMLAGKKGILHIHLGNLTEQLDILIRIVEEYQFPIQHISPTHVGRTESLFEQAILFAKMGGMIDITTGASKYTDPYKSVIHAVDSGVDISRITFSSDGNAGLDKLDSNGRKIGVRKAPFTENYREMCALNKTGGMELQDAIKVITSNPAANLGLKNKGRIAIGADADFCLMDEDLELRDVIAMGKICMKEKDLIIRDTFE